MLREHSCMVRVRVEKGDSADIIKVMPCLINNHFEFWRNLILLIDSLFFSLSSRLLQSNPCIFIIVNLNVFLSNNTQKMKKERSTYYILLIIFNLWDENIFSTSPYILMNEYKYMLYSPVCTSKNIRQEPQDHVIPELFDFSYVI